MHCSNTRELLQDWFDLAGGGSMPPDAAAHIRTCGSCRDFVRKWDHIELGLQALRDSLPSPSPDFKISLETSPVRVKRARLRRTPAAYAKWAAATVSALVAAIGLTYVLTGRGPIPVEKASSLAMVRPAHTSGYIPRPAALNGNLPLA